MITSEQALTRIVDFSDAELRVAVVQAMFDGITLAPSGVREAQPEDVFIALLDGDDSPQRRAVIEGCRDVCGRLLEFLNQPAIIIDAAYEHAFAHFSALLGAARPPELARQVRSLLQLALDDSVPKTVRNPIVRAAVAYAESEADAPFWLAHLEGNLIPGYAFQALLRINPQNSRMEDCLVSLWCRALQGELRLRGPLFAKELLKYQVDPDACLRRVLRRVIEDAPELRTKLTEDCLRYPHSAPWAKLIPNWGALKIRPMVKWARAQAKDPFAGRIELSNVNVFREKNSSQFGIMTEMFADAADIKIIQSIVPGWKLFGGNQHHLLILNTKSEREDEFVASALRGVAANLPPQLDLIRSQQSYSLRA